jgi:hypothetical protein
VQDADLKSERMTFLVAEKMPGLGAFRGALSHRALGLSAASAVIMPPCCCCCLCMKQRPAAAPRLCSAVCAARCRGDPRKPRRRWTMQGLRSSACAVCACRCAHTIPDALTSEPLGSVPLNPPPASQIRHRCPLPLRTYMPLVSCAPSRKQLASSLRMARPEDCAASLWARYMPQPSRCWPPAPPRSHAPGSCTNTLLAPPATETRRHRQAGSPQRRGPGVLTPEQTPAQAFAHSTRAARLPASPRVRAGARAPVLIGPAAPPRCAHSA